MMNETMPTYSGCYRDKVFDGRGRLTYDSGWRKNRIVNNCRVLVAALMNGAVQPGTGGSGIKKLLIGRGDPAWDTTAPGEPPATRDALFDLNPIEVTDLTISFAHDSPGQDPSQPSPVLSILVRLEPGVPVPDGTSPAFPMREFGLVGNWNDTEFLVNLVWHPVIYKDMSATLLRTIELSF